MTYVAVKFHKGNCIKVKHIDEGSGSHTRQYHAAISYAHLTCIPRGCNGIRCVTRQLAVSYGFFSAWWSKLDSSTLSRFHRQGGTVPPCADTISFINRHSGD